MSKINAIQAAALKAPVNKTEPAKKSNPVKVVAPKKVALNKAVAKTAVTAPKTATKPVTANHSLKPDTKKTEKAKTAKEKTPKLKMERDSFTMPKTEYAQFHVLKDRLNKLGQPAKKSELLRAGIMQLAAMTDNALKAALAKVPAIKTGRPKKK